jgi:peptide-N4-(N-acetyl-beta-glucosaminyl)asparagine amidase
MQAQVTMGDSWKMPKVELFKCNNNCNYEYTFPRYGEILKIAEAKTGRCSEWSMLFGAILNSIGIEARIVHDFLDHCWDEVKLIPDGKWVHVDSTLTYPISLDHPYYYEENWGKNYEYVLAFSADKVEDVTKRYTQRWEAIQQRRLSNKKNTTMTDLAKFYSDI